MPCELGTSCTCHNLQKRFCKFWIPGRSSRYHRCARFVAMRVTCDLPNSACATCEHFIENFPRKDAKIDWSDKSAVREYRAAYMRRYRRSKNGSPGDTG